MKIKEIELINFKKFSELKLKFSENVNFIIGRNGIGKTTILEAISYISIPRSFRNVKDDFLIKFNEKGFSIRAVISNLTEHNILIIYKRGGFKLITLDNKRVKVFLKLFEEFPILTFHSNSYNIIDQSPEIRRKFFDWFFSLLNYEYFIYLHKYRKVLEQKNKALKLKSEISIWNKQLEFFLDNIIKLRKNYIEKLNSLISENNKELKISYICSLNNKKIDDFKDIELKRGFSIVGPHRDDYKFYYRNHDAKIFSSEGEKRKIFIELSIAMIKLVEKVKNVKPVVLFDDPFNVLDENELEIILENLRYTNLQVIITATKLSFKIKGNVIDLNSLH